MSETEFQPPALEELAELLPAYEILSFIAAGGMGAVYHATQKSLDREVAIKILPREFGADEEFRAQFAEEAKAMAKLNHPNLIGVYDFGEVDGMPFLVMEFVNGNSLYYSAYEKAVEQVTAGTITLGIAEGLAHAHKAGILHRDIKPANIFLNSDAEPKIGDFGLARPAESGESEGPVFGTPGYTAPEVTMDPASVGTQADVFSLGVILYELLTGERPDENNYVPIYRKVQADRRFDQIVRRAIHPSPHERYETAGAMAEELRRLVNTLESTPSPKILVPPPKSDTNPALLTEPNEAGNKAEHAGTTAPPTPTTRALSTSAGSWHLMRNLVLIIVLAGAVFGVWKAIGHKKNVESHREKEHQEKEAIKESFKKADELAKAPPEETNKNVEETNAPPQPQDTAGPAETTTQALARLKPQLAEKNFIELPPATISRGSSRYLFVETPMTWHEASQYALDHGGHLATFTNVSVRGLLSKKLPTATDAWIGAGTIGRNLWGWVDGSEWNFDQFSTLAGTAAALSDLGTVRPHRAGKKFPFVIQWHTDGSNPGSLKAQLDRALATRDSPNPYWPPGSWHLEKRHFFFVHSKSPRSISVELAKQYQGNLAVVSTVREAKFISEKLNAVLPEGSGCWLGATREGDNWKWISEEPWKITKWREGAPDGDPSVETALRFIAGPNGGWDDANPENSEATPYFLIEWSTDKQDYFDSLEVPAPDSLVKLREIARPAFAKQKLSHQEALAKNAKDYRWELDDWFRQLSGNQRGAYSNLMQRLKAGISDRGVISKKLPRSGAPRRIIDIAEERISKQNSLGKDFLRNCEKLRIAYLQKLSDELKNAQKETKRDAIRAYEREIEKLGKNGKSAKKYFEALE